MIYALILIAIWICLAFIFKWLGFMEHDRELLKEYNEKINKLKT
jgi:hypothetical protein